MAWPGQALAYKVGQLKILELRERAKKALGDKFDIRGFHDQVLDAGALPLDVLSDRIDGWIKRQGTGNRELGTRKTRERMAGLHLACLWRVTGAGEYS